MATHNIAVFSERKDSKTNNNNRSIFARTIQAMLSQVIKTYVLYRFNDAVIQLRLQRFERGYGRRTYRHIGNTEGETRREIQPPAIRASAL